MEFFTTIKYFVFLKFLFLMEVEVYLMPLTYKRKIKFQVEIIEKCPMFNNLMVLFFNINP